MSVKRYNFESEWTGLKPVCYNTQDYNERQRQAALNEEKP